MRRHLRFLVCLVSVSTIQISCSGDYGPKIDHKVPLTKVIGEVSLDGVPEESISVIYTPLSEIAEKRPEFVQHFQVDTSKDGIFALKTYLPGDGVPKGTYAMTFALRGRGNKKKLPADYTDPKKPFLKINVEDDELDLGTIELTSERQ